MYGFLYRDLRIARPMIIASAIMLFYTILAPIIGAQNVTSGVEDITNYNIICLVCYGMNLFFAFMVQNEMHKGDEKRLPVCFAIASPAGVKGYVKSKYLSNLLLPFGIMCISLFTDMIAGAIVDLQIEKIEQTSFINMEEAEPTSFISMIMLLFQVIILLNAIELPFMIRFGVKKGANLKAAFFISILAAAGIYFLFGDISMFGSMDDFMQFLLDVSNGKRGGTTMLAISALMPLVTLALYYLSYLLSCKLYLKGVEQLEQ